MGEVRLQRLTLGAEEIIESSELQQVLHDLTSKGAIPENMSKPLHEVIVMSNQALHGKEIPLLEARPIVEIGVSLLDHLYWHARNFFPKQSKAESLSLLEVDQFREATYRLVSIVPYTENPILNVRLLNQEDLDNFLADYHEYGEFMVELTRIESKPSV